MSRFLKPSTSSDALFLPRAALSVGVRSSPLPLPGDSMEASVLEKGFAGAVLGDSAVVYVYVSSALPELPSVYCAGISRPLPASLVYRPSSFVLAPGKPAEAANDGESAYRARL
jgi:hypothetical protein